MIRQATIRAAVLWPLAALCGGMAAGQTCSCGANPPAPPNRTFAPYANTPEDLEPFSKFTVPYYQHYTKTPEYNGPAREAQTVSAGGSATFFDFSTGGVVR